MLNVFDASHQSPGAYFDRGYRNFGWTVAGTECVRLEVMG